MVADGRVWIGVVLAAAACRPTPQSFPFLASEAACERAEACDPEGFVDLYRTQERCQQRLKNSLVTAGESAADLGCTFDVNDAEACIEDLEEADCATLDVDAALAACGAAYGCVPF